VDHAVKGKSKDPREGKAAGLTLREIRICPTCGTKFSATSDRELCPVCVLLEAAGGGSASAEALSPATGSERSSAETEPVSIVCRFENYEVMLDQLGKPIELGRGAMGVTYKALDIDLRCPVTLKVISEKYVGDKSARLRFLREARAAASVRHPNVASVYHLGRVGKDYFYAMEYVEGETLGELIKRSGRLGVKLALEIATQVASGLAAVHKQKLVHRDIKPSNIMVSSEEGGAVTAKIIDLGLAKSLDEQAAQTTISTPGAFAGTPEFASPEQFAGVPVDIRSDLYSLGVALWEMVTSKVPFRGTPGEVLSQHQRAPLPLELLEALPQPVVVLLEVLLEKDPRHRFQSPDELLKAIPTITGAIEARRRITRQSLQKTASTASRIRTRKPPGRLALKQISLARLPVTGSDVFGREEDIAFLDRAWANKDVNVVTIVAWAGVGKSTLVNHWLRRMAADHYRSAELIFGWSFYRQGSSGETSSADEFFDVALSWFGDGDPRLGTPWEKGERLAKLVAHRRTLLVLDGLESLQNPPGPQEGRLREPSLQALLRELAAFDKGLCVITTRTPVADIADHERTSALRRDLDQLTSDAGAKLLRALGVKGDEAELRSASDDFQGHCLALTLLGSYLTDAYSGDIRWRKEVSERLAHDIRQGAHARKVMISYQTWLGEGPELSILRMLGLFDRPADEKALGALLKSPAIPGLTESLTDLSPPDWRRILARLRRAKLLAGEDPNNPRQLDTHPLVREYFGEQLRNQRTGAWEECNRRLYDHYRMLAPPLPGNLKEMEPLFLAVICGCKASLFHQALNEVYVPRIQRGDVYFAASVLGARGALLTVLAHFFEQGHWGLLAQTRIEGQSLTAEGQLFILMQAAQYLTATRGLGAPEARICYERAESLCRSLGRPLLLYVALTGQWRYSWMADKLSVTLQLAKRLYSLAQGQNDPVLMIGACRSLAGTLYNMGDFRSTRRYAMHGSRLWHSGSAWSPIDEVNAPAVTCLCFEALSGWHLGEIASCQTAMEEGISLAKELKDMHGLAVALSLAAGLAHCKRNPAAVERLGSEVIQLSARQNFALWFATGEVLRGWARSLAGERAEGVSSIEEGIRNYRATGAVVYVPFLLALKAEALHLAARTPEALEAIRDAEALAERFEERFWCAELYRFRGVFLAALNAQEAEIEASFRAAIRIAKEQKSVSLAKRAEATYAEYRRQKASGSEGRGFRLPLS
jgi:serine/threonine protein kinase/predicted ATPase